MNRRGVITAIASLPVLGWLMPKSVNAEEVPPKESWLSKPPTPMIAFQMIKKEIQEQCGEHHVFLHESMHPQPYYTCFAPERGITAGQLHDWFIVPAVMAMARHIEPHLVYFWNIRIEFDDTRLIYVIEAGCPDVDKYTIDLKINQPADGKEIAKQIRRELKTRKPRV